MGVITFIYFIYFFQFKSEMHILFNKTINPYIIKNQLLNSIIYSDNGNNYYYLGLIILCIFNNNYILLKECKF